MGDKTEKQEVGALGEDIACRYLEERGHNIVARNYLKKWGEIDIVSQKGGRTHFIEVKTVSYFPRGEVENWRPEENVHPKKLDRMRRVIQSYLLEKKLEESEWQFDVLAVFLDIEGKRARCRMTEDVVL